MVVFCRDEQIAIVKGAPPLFVGGMNIVCDQTAFERQGCPLIKQDFHVKLNLNEAALGVFQNCVNLRACYTGKPS